VNRDLADFHTVRDEHLAIHARMQNWARWARTSGHRSNVHPMFAGYRDNYHSSIQQDTRRPVDTLDATAIQKLFVLLPQKHRWSVQWCYLFPFIHPNKVCRYLGLTRVGLSDMVHDTRSMLKNRAQ
jgi:hypothetical protein